MDAHKLHRDIIRGYSESTLREWKRLSLKNGVMEYITTVRYIEKYLPSKGLVADIGSAQNKTKSQSQWPHWYDMVLAKPKKFLMDHCYIPFILFVSSVYVLYVLSSFLSWHFLKNDMQSILIYNSLVIAAAIFILTFHLHEFRDVAGQQRKNETQKEKKEGIEKIEHSAFYTAATLGIIIILMFSCLLILAFGFDVLALRISIFSTGLASLFIALLLAFTVRVYIASAMENSR